MNKIINKKIGMWIVLILIGILLFGMLFFTIYFMKHENDEQNDKYIPLEQLPRDYTFEQALKDRCLIVSYKTIYNKERLDEFIKNTAINSSNRIPDIIRVVQCTLEGDMTFTDIEYTKEGKYKIRHDNTRDQYAAEEDRTITLQEFPGEIYSVTEIEEEGYLKVELAPYKNNEHTNSNIDTYKNETICIYSKTAIMYQTGPTFIATVLDVRDKWVLVQPKDEKNLGDKVSLGIPNGEMIAIGDKIKVTYTGMVMETYPSQINAIKIEKVKE